MRKFQKNLLEIDIIGNYLKSIVPHRDNGTLGVKLSLGVDVFKRF